MIGFGILTGAMAVEFFCSGFLLSVSAYEVAKKVNRTKKTTKR